MTGRDAAPFDARLARPLMRFPSAAEHDVAIDAWLHQEPAELFALARAWFGRMRGCGTDVRELLHDGHPTACVGDAAFAYVNVFKAHVNVGFFHGAPLADPAGLLEGAGKHMRHVKLRPRAAFDPTALEALVTAAYADIQRRVAALG